MAEFRAAVRRRDGAAVVDLHGQIDRAAAGPLAAAYDQAHAAFHMQAFQTA